MNDDSATVANDLTTHLDLLRSLPHRRDAALRALFQLDLPIFVARAPGRLDVMGGIADYSGSLVLQLPIAEAAVASLQIANDGRVTAVSRGKGSDIRTVTIDAKDWTECLCCDYRAARQILGRDAHAAWSTYVLGPILVLVRARSIHWSDGLRILIDSCVPEGKGVSSSAAVEVATLRAFAAAMDIDLSGEELAETCQVAENMVAGAPCGIMDQMTAALGRARELLALRCQPATVEAYVPVPARSAFWGLDSGIRHAVTGADYSSVRCGAFMGYRIIADVEGLSAKPSHDDPGYLEIEDTQWNGYLANIRPDEFRASFADHLPARISGAEFLTRYGGTTDHATRVDPNHTYAVRQTTTHPIEENRRVGRFRELLQGEINDDSLQKMGCLMFESHESYSACGLGSDGTDLLVDLVRKAGPPSGLFGAKITGGGSGGTVAVLGRENAVSAVERVAAEYFRLTSRPSYVFRGSSPGACWTDVTQTCIERSV